jgi:DNA (cytosine-5)-methyltransferase 1
MKYGSVCSGVEAATVAWHSLGWQPQWFSEIEKFPSAVLKHHYPAVPNHGDMTKFKEWNDDRPIDVLVGGTPCQSFSVAGLRKGLDDPRGNLMLTYLAIAERYAPKWIVWENVPGVLSSNRGRDFGTFLGALGKLGYGFAYRVLDAQYFGVAQRRKRVFVVGYLGDWRRAAAVLFERESLRGYPAPRREAGKEIADTLTVGANQYSGFNGEPVVGNSTHRMRGFCDYSDDGTASTVKARDYKDATDLIAFPTEMSGTQSATTVNLSPALSVKHTTAVATHDVAGTMLSRASSGGFSNSIDHAAAGYMALQKSQVRRLTPIECERLQGFPDNYTDIRLNDKQTPDAPRYKAMGNSMAVPVMNWIGRRIQMVEEIK